MQTGDLFPSEPELCREFGVARMTVNKVVTELVRDGRLIRKQGKGSFVAEVPREHRVVNFLLPCTGYLTEQGAHLLRKIAFGVAEEARRRNLGIELIPVSPDNDPDHIDFAALEHLNSKSLIVIPSPWFYSLYPFLADRKCRTVLIDRQMRSRYPNSESAERFQILDYDMQEGIAGIIRRFYRQGCRRIALRTAFRKDRPVQYVAYSAEIKRLGLPELALFQPVFSLQVSDEERAELQAFGCDALIFDAFECCGLSGPDFASVVGIPAGLSYETIRFLPEDNQLQDNPPTTSIDARLLGIAALRMLLDPESPARRVLKAEYFPAGKKSSCGMVVNFI